MNKNLTKYDTYYMKKPIAVKAFLWGGEVDVEYIPDGVIHDVTIEVDDSISGKLKTYEGDYTIEAGQHYIVGPGYAGEFWPVAKAIFEATYAEGQYPQLNANDYVRVRITDEGRRILRETHDRLFPHDTLEYREPHEENGWSEFCIWELMAQFGNHMYNGKRGLPFETTMELMGGR